MILIISENNDTSTNIVIEWIVNLGYPFLRINPEDKVKIELLEIDNFTLSINNSKKIKYQDITSVWFRRGYLNFTQKFEYTENKFLNHLKNHLKKEYEAYREYVYFLLLQKKCIGNIKNYHINKFKQLYLAEKCGLLIPKSIFLSKKKELLSFDNLVTKSSNYVLDFTHYGRSYMTYTEKINNKDLNHIPENFMLSFCQENIEKKYDIRAFYFDKSFYSMAILSQMNENTKVDFRKYDYMHPNRRISYELDSLTKSRVINLMAELKLLSGSLDFVLDTSDRLVFLEVNPIGQFGMVDFPCNYGLHEMIARFLTEK